MCMCDPPPKFPTETILLMKTASFCSMSCFFYCKNDLRLFKVIEHYPRITQHIGRSVTNRPNLSILKEELVNIRNIIGVFIFVSVVYTSRGLPLGYAGFTNYDLAQPGADYAPIFVQTDYTIPIDLEIFDDCDVENSEVFTVEAEQKRNQDWEGYRVILVKDNDGMLLRLTVCQFCFKSHTHSLFSKKDTNK